VQGNYDGDPGRAVDAYQLKTRSATALMKINRNGAARTMMISSAVVWR
jgi:hypothetical protein